MASNKKSSRSVGKIVLKIPSSSSPKPPLPAQSPPSTPLSPGLNMGFFPLDNDHRSSVLSPAVKLFYDEVFKKLPQSPHFNPLESLKSEKLKEGFKLGSELAFLQLVHKFRDIDDPCTFLTEVDEFTEEFKELEKHGYDLTKIRDRFNLLKRKAEVEMELKDTDEKLVKEKRKREEKIEKKEVLHRELEAEILRVAEELKLERSEVDSIDNKRRKIMGESDMNATQFKNLANKPW